uniref:Uncharacterized protein n=1 Tax=Oncorhynchus kisutch TaxID=8019 RepID=A0A8C7MW76_ONCKI
MHPPERPWVSPAPCQQAASAPQGTLCTGPLRGLQLAMPSLGRLLPRFHAADSVTPAPVQIPSPLPSLVGQPEFPDTGWDCIKDLFGRESFMTVTPLSYCLCLPQRSAHNAAIRGFVRYGLR